MSEPLLEVRHLKKYFTTPKGLLHAVDDVSFSIEEGKTLGLVGESGCGKSTTGRVILRLHEATDGEVLYRGRNILELSPREMREMRRKMQIVFQDPYSSLNPRMSVKSLIEESLRQRSRGMSSAEREKKVLNIMDLVGLERRLANSYPHELDGGRRQRTCHRADTELSGQPLFREDFSRRACLQVLFKSGLPFPCIQLPLRSYDP